MCNYKVLVYESGKGATLDFTPFSQLPSWGPPTFFYSWAVFGLDKAIKVTVITSACSARAAGQIFYLI